MSQSSRDGGVLGTKQPRLATIGLLRSYALSVFVCIYFCPLLQRDLSFEAFLGQRLFFMVSAFGGGGEAGAREMGSQ
jgi:hypothetical protein